jgi:hypothetical protein
MSGRWSARAAVDGRPTRVGSFRVRMDRRIGYKSFICNNLLNLMAEPKLIEASVLGSGEGHDACFRLRGRSESLFRLLPIAEPVTERRVQ